MTTERQALKLLPLTEEHTYFNFTHTLIEPHMLLLVTLKITLMSWFQCASIFKNHQEKDY